jgi:hypothetical protein
MPPLDEQARLLDTRLWVLAIALAGLATSSCRLTEVALVTARNETNSEVGVRVRLPGDPVYREDLTLAPAQESTLLKYEDPRHNPRSLPSLVDGLQLAAGGCVARLEAPALARAAVRTESPRRWTVRLTPELLKASGCPLSP